MSNLTKERAIQTKLMMKLNNIVRIIMSYGGHVLIENPTHSKFWKQSFMKRIEQTIAETRTARSFLLNRCKVGGIHFKQYKFYTSLPPIATAHMELTCDHSFKHPPCLGRDANGNSVTKASGVYTNEMVFMIVACIGMLTSKSPDAVKTIGKHMHCARAAQHEHNRLEAYVPFEDATSESYFADAIGISAPCKKDKAYDSFLRNAAFKNDSFSTCVLGATKVANAAHNNNIGVRTEPNSSHRKPPVLGGGPTHLWMMGAGSSRIMKGVSLMEPFNISKGTARVAVPTSTNIPSFCEVPINHLRPYVPLLEGTPWACDNPADVTHPKMLLCSEPGCCSHATHDDGTTDTPYHCCSSHCTCFDKYTSFPLHADDEGVTASTGHSLNHPHVPGHESYLAETKLRLYWDRIRDLPDKVKGGIEVIRFGENVPPDVLKYVQHHIKRLRRVFESAKSGLPLRVNGDSVRINLKDNAHPKRCPQPKWGYGAKRDILTKWAKQQIACGMFEHAVASPWASRPHIAHKAIRGTSKEDDVFDIRIVGDYVYVNSQIERLQPCGPDAMSQVQHASGHHAYWYTDGDQQYQGWAIDDVVSRNALAIWTPIGLIRPTRLQFGERNAGVVTQGAVTIMLESDIDPKHRAHIINGADDFTGFADHVMRVDGTVEIDWWGLAKSFVAMVEMADKNNMSLKASKTFFGSPEADFWGHTLDKDGHRAAIHNLDPIAKMVAPNDVSELRRVLGLMVQHKDGIPTWAFDARCLHTLTRKGEAFDWTPERNAAFERLRDACLANRILAAPDYSKQFRVGCDASDDGKGIQLYQLSNINLPDTPDNRNTIAYYSKAWSPAMAKRPPYYKEADALITGLTLAKPYADASPFPIIAITDHAPLQWIKTAAKGPVTGWRIENLAGMDYTIEYRPGPQNGIPDALSRHPFLGPRQLTRVGTENALSFLLEALPESCRNPREPLWFWAAKDTARLIKRVKLWRGGGMYINRSPKSACLDKSWRFAIAIPRADTATETCRMIIKSGRPACVLMPSDLVHYVPQNMDGTFDANLTSAIDSAPKYTILAANLTWVMFGIPDALKHMVCINEHLVDYMPPHIPDSHAATIGTLVQWAAEQPESLEKERELVIDSRIGTADSGLRTYTPADMPRIYVPERRRRPLFDFIHKAINHMAALKTYNELSKSYYWPTMKRDSRKWYTECSRCELLKAKRNITHSRYRGVSGEAPRKEWQIDFHGVGAEDAKANVLGAIDKNSLHVELDIMNHRTAENVERFIRDRILFRAGTPTNIHSDHARELIGSVMTRLANTFGYINTSTGGYCATGNSIIESFWQYFNICLRNLSDEEYLHIEDHLQHIAWAWNTTVHATTGERPFAINTGTSPVTLADSLVLPPPNNTRLDMSNIREAAAAYTTAAREHGDYMRKLRADMLNEKGRLSKPFVVGDHVKIYVPPSQGEAMRRRRKAKHICQWRGPLIITTKLSNTTFELKSYFNHTKTFRRHISNIRRWRGPLPDVNTDENLMLPFVSDVEEGEFVLVRDSPSARIVYLARVNAVDDNIIDVSAWGSTKSNQACAKFKPVMILDDSLLPMINPRAGTACSPWKWQLPAGAVADLVIARDLCVLPSGKLDPAARKILRNLSSGLALRRFLS